jgi:hypothetical protein
MLYRVSRNLRPVQSWPSRLAREGSYVMRGDTRFTSAVLDDLHRDGDLGPMGSLLVAETLAAGDATQRGRFATRAAGLRSARGLETDYYNVMQRDAALARVIRFVLPALASLTEPEVAAVTEGMPAADATFVRGLVTTLRTTKLEDAASALRPVFDRWCQSRIEAAATPASAATAESKAAVH